MFQVGHELHLFPDQSQDVPVVAPVGGRHHRDLLDGHDGAGPEIPALVADAEGAGAEKGPAGPVETLLVDGIGGGGDVRSRAF